MKLNNQQIEQAVGKKDVRYYLNEAYLQCDDEGMRILATDGHILAVVPVESDEPQTEGFISVEALKAGRKAGSLTANGSLSVPSGASFPRPLTRDDGAPDAKFPDVKRIIPEHSAAPDVQIDAELIIRLARALCDVKGTNPKLINLHFAKKDDGSVDPGSAVYVEPANGNGYGVVMPCR
jgi:hypothetical protein